MYTNKLLLYIGEVDTHMYQEISRLEMDSKLVRELRAYLGAIFLQFGYAGLGIIAKLALNKGMSNYTFAVYRNLVAAIVVAPFAFALERLEFVAKFVFVFVLVFV